MRNLIVKFLPVVVVTALSACASTGSPPQPPAPKPVLEDGRYAAVTNEPFNVPAVNLRQFDPEFRRQLVDDPTGEQPGTLVVDPENRFLYLVMADGKAMRYGVGVGRAGMAWSGTANVAYKREWPTWTPTQNMIKRDPDTYQKWAGGMEGGPTRSARRTRALPVRGRQGHALPYPRHQRAVVDRPGNVVGLYPYDEPGRHGPLSPRPGRRKGRRSARHGTGEAGCRHRKQPEQ
nr:L,D-transpeptidase [Marinicella sp. W31]MDC2876481.1 L,D-transpeptidase [Marinicella sp. W31]